MRRACRLMAGLALLATAAAAPAPPTLGYWDNWTDAAGVSHLTRCAMRRFALQSASRPKGGSPLAYYSYGRSLAFVQLEGTGGGVEGLG